MMRKSFLIGSCFLLMMVQSVWSADRAGQGDPDASFLTSPLSLSQCIELALEQNQKRRISKLAVDTAEYQHQQALSAFWPQLAFEAGYNQLDEDVNFIFPQNTFTYSVPLPPMLGGGAISGQTVVPEQDVTVKDKESMLYSLDLTYPLFTGGLRSSTVKAARSNIRAAEQAMRRTELDLVRDVQRMYYGVVLSQRLSDIGRETLTRLQTTTELTERLYKTGSGSVTKLDYLRSQVVLESARAIVERLVANVSLARAALGNTMGLKWDMPVSIAESNIPFVALKADLNQWVAGAYEFNPDWKQLGAALDAAQALVRKEQSGHWPKVGLSGKLWRWDNELEGSGLATDENQDGWSIGLGVQIPLFNGFLTTNKIKTAKARLEQMKSRQILLREGLALQVKHGFIRVARSQKIRTATVKAAGHALEHRELAIRAYMNELITTEKVIESQIFEALARAKSEMAQYENATARFDIDYLVGREVQKIAGIDH